MKYLFLFFLQFSILGADHFVLRDYEKNIKNMGSIKSVIRKYKDDKLIKHLRDFVACCRPSRMVGTKSHAKASVWLVDRLKQIDPKANVVVDEFTPDIEYAKSVYREDFQKEVASNYPSTSSIYKKWNNFTNSMTSHLEKLRTVKGKNIIWEKKGSISPDEVIILGAHYDTISYDKENLVINFEAPQPGADNNASGVASLLSLIEILTEVNTPKTVRVVFFDYQEFAFLGARAYVKKYKEDLKSDKFAGFVNLLMLGHDTKRNDKGNRSNNFKVYTRKESDPLHGLDLKLANKLIKAGDKSLSGMRFELDPNGFNRSDHVSFWEEGLAAVTFTQNWEEDPNPKNHTSNDFVETLNFRSLDNAFRFISASIIAWTYDII
ncbi:hypothetical protein BIY24_08990 [Halobacteriovorax marinus]|uniref:M28 family metallopeptidase n=1 Tax=Halobacteriovorax marinus TaxID=97084 RepID=UPI000BC3262B|nr:M28 family peptidase [Halobacteriovorax marinus]ATH08080.1 hypothetical protein BIY24_08990 [Halobacteriovorax marinus]